MDNDVDLNIVEKLLKSFPKGSIVILSTKFAGERGILLKGTVQSITAPIEKGSEHHKTNGATATITFEPGLLRDGLPTKKLRWPYYTNNSRVSIA